MSETGTDIKVRKGSGGGKPIEPPPGTIIEHRPSAVEPPTKASGSNPGAFAFVGQAVTISSSPDHPLSALFSEAQEGKDWLTLEATVVSITIDEHGAPQWAVVDHRKKRKTLRSLIPVHGCAFSMIHDPE